MPAITRLEAGELLESAGELGELLADAVAGGSSVGFLAPLAAEEAAGWWRGLAAGVGDGSIALWAARDGGRLLGTVQLRLAPSPNSRHRAELAKLIVHSGARGRGLGRELLAHAEREAAGLGVSLLLLDTQTGSPAERLYAAAGWTRLGSVPRFAADPAGTLRPTTFFHKSLV
ncbi:GNAT family N-acetyltransferase [Kitasatospora sp. NPDC048540]|uniref:GNAT family N-acetyltransferase n=1 Tax=unclassified Kitasatospora TaxID=2633591 RepID=UPI000539B97B|nr:GNAT family N-acetyltransferase [Kitasatospora sp. MBT63]